MGDIHQNIYLGPIIFLAAGVAFHWTVGYLSSLMRRGWLASALAVMAAGAITLAGVGAIWQDSPYKTPENIKSVLAALEERAGEEDMVYAVWGAVPPIQFYRGEEGRPDNYYYGTIWCPPYAGPGLRPCLREMVDLVALFSNVPDRIFLIYDEGSMLEELELLGEQVSVEHVIAGNRTFNLVLIENIKESDELAARPSYGELASGEPAARSTFDVYLSGNTLVYVKEPCAPADAEAIFFLHLHPVDVNDLPDHRQQHGFDNLDFSFDRRGVMFNGKCLARIPLPGYDIIQVRTGQYVPGEGRTWQVEIPFAE